LRLDLEKIAAWAAKGAQISPRVKALMKDAASEASAAA